MSKVTDFLSSIRPGEPQVHENLKVYPLHINNGHSRGYRTLNEAMEASEIVVEEISESGSVPNLSVHNSGTLPVLIVVGEELVGAKQNRILNTSLLVPAQSNLEVPVSCVEQGRWAYTSRVFNESSRFGHSTLRMTQTKNVTKNLRTRHVHDASQGEVWSEVTRKISSHRSTSSTASLHDVYTQTEDNLKGYLDGLKPPESEGILVAINGQIVGGDLFDHSETMQKLWQKLIRSYALDALEKKAQQVIEDEHDSAIKFIELAQTATQEVYDAIGLGKDIRLTGEQVTGSSLLWNEHSIHTSLFNSL